MNSSSTWLANHFLIAMPSLSDPSFYRTVTYICEHDADGAMGIVINQTLDISFSDVLQSMDLSGGDESVRQKPVFLGGPVQTERGFVIHEPLGAWESSLEVSKNLGLTVSRDIIEATSQNRGPERSLIALGYAGWSAGQLEQELADNSWLAGPANTDIIFELPVEKRWEAAASLLGVDINSLSTDIGHA